MRDGRSGRFHVAIECHACFEWLLPVSEKFRKHRPDVDVNIRPNSAFDALPSLQKEDVGLVIPSNPEDIPELDFKHFLDYETFFVTSKTRPLAQKNTAQPMAFETKP